MRTISFTLVVVVAALSPAVLEAGQPASPSFGSGAPMDAACFASVAPSLRAASGKLTPDVRNAYLAWSKSWTMEQLHDAGTAVPDECLAEVKQDDTLRDALFGSVYPPDPSILQNYAQLRAQLGADFALKHRQLVIAFAVARRTKGVEKPDTAKEIGRAYQPGFWTDESLQVPGSDDENLFARRIADFMQQSGASASDLYTNAGLQQDLKGYLVQHGVSQGWADQVKKWVPFGQRLKYAMTLVGQRPAAREPKPAVVDWMRHLVDITSTHASSTPNQNGKPMPWPLFPVDTAPWPLLMPLSHPVPISEANYIWEAFQGEHGTDRYHTYGPYRGDDDLMPDSLKPSKWFWDAWPDRIVHGGMCVPISKGTVDLYSALGKPAMWAGQPGHANLISFQYGDGLWTAEIEQAFAGGPDVTTAQWYFDDSPEGVVHHRDLYMWPFSEYHLGLPLAMDVSLASYMDTRIAVNIYRAMPSEDQHELGVRLLTRVLATNPFNPDVWYLLALVQPDSTQNLPLAEAAVKGDLAAIAQTAGGSALASRIDTPCGGQYWHTLAQFFTQFGLLSHTAPREEQDVRRVYNFLKSVPGVTGADLADYVERTAAAHGAGAGALQFDQSQAQSGDAYGLLRMGMRWRDGDGVPVSDVEAQASLARAASQGDGAAAAILGRLYPFLPAGMIKVTASSTFSKTQAPEHLIDGSGMSGAFHDNDQGAGTMWQTVTAPAATPPTAGLAPSPAWVRFDFQQPIKVDAVLIWNHNQWKLADRGFCRSRVYATTDGTTWVTLTGQKTVTLPRAGGERAALPITIPNGADVGAVRAVIVAADSANGNYGGDCYGLSGVRFVVRRLNDVLPTSGVAVTASSEYSASQAAIHLLDGSGMIGALHDNARGAETMWQTFENPGVSVPAAGVPASHAWVRFDFPLPQQLDSILIWNHNQANLTDRGLRKVRIYGTSDGSVWRLLTLPQTLILKRATGDTLCEPASIRTSQSDDPVRAVIIEADETDGNYGGNAFGLSAVRFVVRH